MDTSEIKDNEFEQNLPSDNAEEPIGELDITTVEPTVKPDDAAVEPVAELDEVAVEITEQAAEPNEQTAQQCECKAETNEPIAEESDVPKESPAPISPASKTMHMAIGVISSVIPILTGIIAAIIALGCDINTKYLTEPASVALTVTVAAAILIPFICSILLSRKSEGNTVTRISWNSLLPLAASIFLAYHTLVNDLGQWGNAILLLSLVATAFFILKMFNNRDTLKILCAIGMFALGTAIIGLLYLDFEIELNSPFKLAVQFGGVALMLGTIADARATLSRIKTGWFIFFKSVASSLCLICAGLVFTAFARGFKILPDVYLVLAIFYACYAVNSIAEIMSASIPIQDSDIDINT